MPKIICTDLKAFFSGIIENVMYADVGICDPSISEYLINLLISYLHIDDLFPFKENDTLTSIEELLRKLKNNDEKRKFYRYVGDFAMFWSGLYPENIQKLQHIGLGFSAKDYTKNGKFFYVRASTLSTSKDVPPQEVLNKLSAGFEYCVYGLKLVRRELQ